MSKNKKQNLLDNSSSESSSDSESEDNQLVSSSNRDEVRINRKYATAYQSRKQKEELAKVCMQGDVEDYNESSSDESSEDEDAELLTTNMDVSILKTINALRNKDKRIYDPSNRFFQEDVDDFEEDNNGKQDKKHKPKRFKDVIREQILQDIEDEEKGTNEGKRGKEQNTEAMSKLEYDEEQKNLRSAFLDKDGEKDGEEEEENWMVFKGKGKANDDSNAQETEEMLRNEISHLEKSGHRDKIIDPHGEVEDGEQFLLDFIKNKKWIDHEKMAEDDDGDSYDNDNGNEGVGDDDSIEELERTDAFESKYNMRFEEAAAAAAEGVSGADHSVIAYARGNTMNTLRRKDETRRQKRLERKERKAAERKAKEEQLRRLKNAKREEMEMKLKQIKSVIGDTDGEIEEDMLAKLVEGDFDPDKFEDIMKEAYGDDFYDKEDKEWKTDGDVRESLQQDDDGNMIVGEDDADGGLYDNYNEDENEEEGEEDYGEDDEAFIMDNEEGEGNVTEKKLKAKMMDELYKLDYEDIVAGMPTRFKYRKVEANNYGLNAEEILFARDTTLKQFVSLKKMAPYQEGEEFRVHGKKRRRFRDMLRHEIEEELEQEIEQDGAHDHNGEDTEEVKKESEEEPKKKRRRKKKGKKNVKYSDEAAISNLQEKESKELNKKESAVKTEEMKRKKKGTKTSKPASLEEIKSVLDTNTKGTGKKNRKKKGKKSKASKVEGVSASRLSSYGIQ
eukprot:CAMPEP_0195289924 /NCGR_PEP_ID=MMETSP0707-20130614/6000_1 /TAXON_ID=33640 /ORGANISM="Asterionellopsis glacialis, Strain CCMP134" /LENGTH=729 /DNA_ID=CAMNT_0040349983 /DNA_START=41 /DNA_END=2230 /DNA_ORIENTATION=+